MFGAVGAPIERLVRVRIGPVRIDGLRSGSVRPLKAPEIRGLAGGGGSSRRRRDGPAPARASQARGLLAAILPRMDGASKGSAGSSSPSTGPARRARAASAPPRRSSVGYRFCDTGLLYRAVTWLAERRGVAVDDPERARARSSTRSSSPPTTRAGWRRSSSTASTTPTTSAARRSTGRLGRVGRAGAPRPRCSQRQRDLAAAGGIVMAGRDIGTVVLPDADLKIFLDASVEERARRRAEERGLDPDGPEAEAILEALRRRDELDRNRAVAPLRPAPDARIIATDGNRFEDTVEAVVGRDPRRRGAPVTADAPEPPPGPPTATTPGRRADRAAR